jgi:putative transcriptional regulator
MAGHFQTGVRLQPGSLLIATPRITQQPWRRSVIMLTETKKQQVMGIILNCSTMMTTDDVTDFAIPRKQIHVGGPIQNSALFMLHTAEFQSSNTLNFHTNWALSSDTLMFEKLSFGQEPAWYRFYMGAAGWHPKQLERELAEQSWLVLPNPSYELISADTDDQWQLAVDTCSQNMFADYL